MSDIIIAGSDQANLGVIMSVLDKNGEKYDRVDTELVDPEFYERTFDECPAVIISMFNEGDLASVKAMQSIRQNSPFVQCVFVTEQDLSSSILTLLFNEGAFGVLREPIEEDRCWRLVKQAIKRSKWDLDSMVRNAELKKVNERLRKRIEQAENQVSRSEILMDRFERLVKFLLTEKSFKLASVRVLVVSHTLYQRNLAEEELGAIGFTVKSTDTAKGALDLVKSYRPHIIISDLELDDMSGVELSKAIKTDAVNDHIFFIITTATPEKIDYILSPDTMADDCVVKPSDARKYYAMTSRVALGLLNI